MKIKQNIKKHKLIVGGIIEKEVFISHHGVSSKMCTAIVSLLSDYLTRGEDFNYRDMKIRSTRLTYTMLLDGPSLIPIPQLFMGYIGWMGFMEGYLLGMDYFVHNAMPDDMVEIYNKEELIGKIKWQWIQ